MQQRTPYRDDDPETIQAVYASYGRLVLDAPPPEGSVTIDAADETDFRRQWANLFETDGEDGGAGAADHVRAPGHEADSDAGRD